MKSSQPRTLGVVLTLCLVTITATFAQANSQNAPGQTGATPGQSGNTPGQGGQNPGQTGTSPGQSGNTPGQGGSENGPVKTHAQISWITEAAKIEKSLLDTKEAKVEFKSSGLLLLSVQ
jgi:hypothetical protein